MSEKLTGVVWANDGNTARILLSNGDYVKIEREGVSMAVFLEDFPIGPLRFDVDAIKNWN